jgi:hypothetical protein
MYACKRCTPEMYAYKMYAYKRCTPMRCTYDSSRQCIPRKRAYLCPAKISHMGRHCVGWHAVVCYIQVGDSEVEEEYITTATFVVRAPLQLSHRGVLGQWAKGVLGQRGVANGVLPSQFHSAELALRPKHVRERGVAATLDPAQKSRCSIQKMNIHTTALLIPA